MSDFICPKCKSKILTKRWSRTKIEVKCACPREIDYVRTDNDDDSIKKFLDELDLPENKIIEDLSPELAPEPEPEPETFEFLKELEEKNKEKPSFKIHYRETMKYDAIKFENIKDLQLVSKLEDSITSSSFFEGIYEYQKQTYEKIIAGKNVAITAPTGTGKTLSFILPIIQKIINEGVYGKLHAIIVTPIKALTSDQFEQIKRYTDCTNIRVGMITGDTSQEDRAKIMAKPPEILLTNFDFIYFHIKKGYGYSTLFTNFKILVVDEIHYYSGIHGSNIHHIIASLKRRNPKLQLIGASATIDNLKGFSQKLFDSSEIDVINSNQKNGLTEFIMMAPLGISFTTLLMNFCKELKRQKKQFLIFWDSKTGVEKFAWRASKQGIQIEPHRAGLKANERKEIESKLKSRQLDGLICTPTLELGIDIGSLEVVFSILVPWSKFKQRMGRAGRRDTPGYGFLILGDDPVSEWFKKYPEDFKNEHIVHINPKNKRVSNFMIPFRVLNTNKLQNNLIKKGEPIYRKNISVFKQKELFLETNDFVEGNRGGIQLHLKKYNIRGMGDEVKIFQKPLKGSKQTFDIKNQIGTETTPLAYQKFHIGAIYMHRKKVFRIIETHLLPNDENADRYVIVESVPNPKYYTTPTVDKSPTIPSDSQFSERIIGGIRIKLTDLDIDKTIRGYKRFNIYDDTPFDDLIDNDVRVVVPRDGLSPYVSNTATDLNNPMIGSDEEDVDKRDDRKQEKEFSVNLENNDLPNYYKILGVQPDSTLENIKKNFRELAKKTHPDKTKEDSLQKMKRINQAYDTLSNKESREKYDKTIRGYKQFNIYDDTPSEDLMDNDVRAVVTRGRSTPHYVSDIELDTNHPVIDCNGEEFTFSTRGIVLDIPIQEKDTSQVGDKIYEVKQEILDGLHVIEHVLQHAGVTIANISHENLDGIYNNSTKSTEFKKIYVYDDSGDGESGAVEAIFHNIDKVILRAFEMLSLCEGPKNNKCDEPSGCSKCSFLMLKCSQFNEHLYKPEAVKILEKIVNSIFEGKLETFKHQKWNNLKESDEFLKEIHDQFRHLIPNVSEQILELKNYHDF